MSLLAANGIHTPTPIQALTIPDALRGRDICGKAETGSGKTLAFGLPLVQRTSPARSARPTALVLVPTRELARQVTAAIRPFARLRGLRVLAVLGGASMAAQARALRTGAEIVVATPGRLNDLRLRGEVSLRDVQVAVLDEADQLADLGFMPQVERLLDEVGHPRQVMLFSATLDEAIDRIVGKYQERPVFHQAPRAPRDAEPVQHRFIAVDPREKVAVAASIAAGPERTILFVRTQRAADRLAMLLDREGVRAGRLHGGLSQPQRERALRDFTTGRVGVLVATNIAARGIHVDGIDIVVHHDPPDDAKTYVHRSGRTARAGASGIVVTLVEPGRARDVDMLRRQARIREAVVAMRPDDPRLADLAAWQPPLD
jgi:superfamily II DNA/RNA helicase